MSRSKFYDNVESRDNFFDFGSYNTTILTTKRIPLQIFDMFFGMFQSICRPLLSDFELQRFYDLDDLYSGLRESYES